MTSVLGRLREFSGLNLNRTTVERAVTQRMDATGCADRQLYAQQLDEAELAQLLELVVVPESWLFRDPQAFLVATEFARNKLAGGARLVRILSVPCAGGEEPYSMAMALRDGGIPADAFVIDAIDISTACIQRASSGIFGKNAFRSQELGFRDRYFDQLPDGGYRIHDAIRQHVRFRQGNVLHEDAAPRSKYDIIFCRNLLIYFDKPTTAAAIARLSAMLDDDGVVLAGYAEVPSFTVNGFAPLPHRQAFALRKDIHRAGPPALGGIAIVEPPRPAPPRPRAPAAAQPAARQAGKPRPARAAAAAPAPKSAPAAKPAAEALLATARQLADQGRSREAADACRDYLQKEPESADAYFILGMLAETAQQSAEAESHLKRCLYLQPDHYEALCHLALLTEQGGNRSAAATLKARAARAYQRQQAET